MLRKIVQRPVLVRQGLRSLSMRGRDDQRLLRELCAKIRFSGPITVAEYMREVLTNPVQGIYMNNSPLGAEGHFVTSPEISQVFGECIGIWLLNEWMKMGAPLPMQIVELGPGKGTLLNDILRTITQLRPKDQPHISLHLVEISEEMRKLQVEKLCGSPTNLTKSKYGNEIFWYDNLRDVPKQFSLFISHEFFDALPIHKFVKTKEGWREILIDVDTLSEEPKLRYIRSRNETPTALLVDPFHSSDDLELCPQAGIICKQISDRIDQFGGIGLIADYGGSNQTDTFRAFRNHKQVDPLELPGTADLTADVDFNYISSQISPDCSWFGPITQAAFLHYAGIGTRCQQLLRGGADEKIILDAYQTLTSPEKMGERFKFACLFPKTMESIHKEDPPVGFAKESTLAPQQ